MSWPWRCWAFGHRWTLVMDRGHVFLECAACGSTTPGWWVRSEGTVEIVKPRASIHAFTDTDGTHIELVDDLDPPPVRDKPPRLEPERGVDPTWENCQASWHKFHKFDDYGDDGQVRCRYCGRLFDDCLQLREDGVLGDV